MNPLTALIFPVTEPSQYIMAKLLVFFDSVSYYLPIELSSDNSGADDLLSDLITAYVPAPLSEDELFRFRRQLHDMGTCRPDELTRLFSAVNAPLAAGGLRDLDEVSSSSVYSSLQKNHATKTDTLYKERLWQSRLILKLAEVLDKREAEVRQGLSRVSSTEQRLFAALDGADIPDTNGLPRPNALNKTNQLAAEDVGSAEPFMAASGLLMPLRLKAWAELYCADSAGQQPEILVTADPESSSILLEGYENFQHRKPQELFSLSLPILPFTGNELSRELFFAGRKTFSHAACASKEFLATYLLETSRSDKAATDKQISYPGLTENLAQWHDILQQNFPTPAEGLSKLVFYCLPDIAFPELFKKLFHPDDAVPAINKQKTGSLLAVLH